MPGRPRAARARGRHPFVPRKLKADKISGNVWSLSPPRTRTSFSAQVPTTFRHQTPASAEDVTRHQPAPRTPPDASRRRGRHQTPAGAEDAGRRAAAPPPSGCRGTGPGEGPTCTDQGAAVVQRPQVRPRQRQEGVQLAEVTPEPGPRQDGADDDVAERVADEAAQAETGRVRVTPWPTAGHRRAGGPGLSRPAPTRLRGWARGFRTLASSGLRRGPGNEGPAPGAVGGARGRLARLRATGTAPSGLPCPRAPLGPL